jgi:hypothetical protein
LAVLVSSGIAFASIVHLRDGKRIGGRYGADSFASSSPAEEQIYLEEVWSLDAHGSFFRGRGTLAGVLIMKSEIIAVELFRYLKID